MQSLKNVVKFGLFSVAPIEYIAEIKYQPVMGSHYMCEVRLAPQQLCILMPLLLIRTVMSQNTTR